MIDSGVWLFATAYLLSVASPGPGIAAIVSRTLARGWHGALIVMKYAGAVYLLYLAYRMWTSATVLPTVVDLETLAVADALAMAVVIPIMLAGVMGAYVTASVRARGFFTSRRSCRRLNRCGAIVMTGAAVIVARS